MSFGERLRLVREAHGLTIDAAAAAADVPVIAWKNFETLKKLPIADGALASTARVVGVDEDFLTRQSALTDLVMISTPPEEMSQAELARLTAHARLALERHLDIEALTPSEDRRYAFAPEGFPVAATARKEVAAVADRVRQIWELGTSTPLPHLADLLEMAGFRIIFVPDQPQFSAAAFVTIDNLTLPVIAVNSDLSGDRQRMAMAQAFAYFLIQDVTPSLTGHFAGGLLLPAQAMFDELSYKRDDIELLELHMMKHKYGVSIRNIVTRAVTLQIITVDTYRVLMDAMKANGWMEQEPGKPYPAEQPQHLYRRVMRLQIAGEISLDEAAHLLGLPTDEWLAHLALER